MASLEVTSVAHELGWRGESAEPSTASVEVAAGRFSEAFARGLEAAAHLAGPVAIG